MYCDDSWFGCNICVHVPRLPPALGSSNGNYGSCLEPASFGSTHLNVMTVLAQNDSSIRNTRKDLFVAERAGSFCLAELLERSWSF